MREMLAPVWSSRAHRRITAQGLLDIAIQKGLQLRLRQGPNLSGLYLTIFEQHQRGYATNTVFRWSGLIGINVDFADLQAVCVLTGDFGENR